MPKPKKAQRKQGQTTKKPPAQAAVLDLGEWRTSAETLYLSKSATLGEDARRSLQIDCTILLATELQAIRRVLECKQ